MISHDHPELLATTLPWRRSRLRRAGLGAQQATELAADPAFDVPALLALVARGCPPELAARILAPLERPPR
jgi:hypothetical protein